MHILANILDFYHILDNLIFLLEPFTSIIGMPPSSALAILSGIFLNLYAAIAFASTLELTPHQWSILAIFLGICHSLVIESAIMKKIGINLKYSYFLRIISAFIVLYIVTFIPSEYFSSEITNFTYTQEYENSALELTIEGSKFLNSYNKKDFNKCRFYILNQLYNIKYPNKATKNINLKLFPFKILFKLLLENNDNGIDSDFIKEQLVNIVNLDSLNLYIQNKNLESIPKNTSYENFYTWVINSLVDIEILKIFLNKYFISDALSKDVNSL